MGGQTKSNASPEGKTDTKHIFCNVSMVRSNLSLFLCSKEKIKNDHWTLSAIAVLMGMHDADGCISKPSSNPN